MKSQSSTFSQQSTILWIAVGILFVLGIMMSYRLIRPGEIKVGNSGQTEIPVSGSPAKTPSSGVTEAQPSKMISQETVASGTVLPAVNTSKSFGNDESAPPKESGNSGNSGISTIAALPNTPSPQQSPNTLAVVAIQPLPSLTEKFTAAGKSLSLRYMSEAMDGQLIASLNNTRKFKIMASSDLKQIIKSQDSQNSGNYNLDDPNTAKQFKLAGIKWGLVTTVDDFEDQTEKLQNNASRTLITKRTVRLGATCKIYDITKGELLEAPSTNFTETTSAETLLEASNNAQATDELLGRVTRDMAKWAAQNVVYKAFTVRVIAKTDRQVTINLGEEAGAMVGQVWTANAPGKELKDPDTGEVLGREEIQVGKVKIIEIQPKLSKGEILDGDLGVAEGAILHLTTAGNMP